MKTLKNTSTKTYLQLIETIQKTIASGRLLIQKAQAETYWKIGKLIPTYILHGNDRPEYGKHVYEKLKKALGMNQRTLSSRGRRKILESGVAGHPPGNSLEYLFGWFILYAPWVIIFIAPDGRLFSFLFKWSCSSFSLLNYGRRSDVWLWGYWHHFYLFHS